MKTVYLIGGTMGVGKTAVCQALKKTLSNCVFLDGDWCWDAHPFHVTDETRAMVEQNICFLLNQFIRCSVYENVVFCWVMHMQGIIDSILANIDTESCRVVPISLVCNPETLRERLQKDIDSGIRSADVLERSIARIPLYEKLDTIKIRTDGKGVQEIAEHIAVL
ncbi:MAG: AAA family ATPase [Christensenellales bacterium]|jgi:broad-specificity NMP kinase